MTYLITYLYYGEPTTVECELKDGKFWIGGAISIPFENIIRVEVKQMPVITLSYTIKI